MRRDCLKEEERKCPLEHEGHLMHPHPPQEEHLNNVVLGPTGAEDMSCWVKRAGWRRTEVGLVGETQGSIPV